MDKQVAALQESRSYTPLLLSIPPGLYASSFAYGLSLGFRLAVSFFIAVSNSITPVRTSDHRTPLLPTSPFPSPCFAMISRIPATATFAPSTSSSTLTPCGNATLQPTYVGFRVRFAMIFATRVAKSRVEGWL